MSITKKHSPKLIFLNEKRNACQSTLKVCFKVSETQIRKFHQTFWKQKCIWNNKYNYLATNVNMSLMIWNQIIDLSTVLLNQILNIFLPVSVNSWKGHSSLYKFACFIWKHVLSDISATKVKPSRWFRIVSDHSLLPEGPEWSYAWSSTDHDYWYIGVIRHFELSIRVVIR